MGTVGFTRHLVTHFPAESPDGPWGVDSVGSVWLVIHKVTGRTKRIGRVIGVSGAAIA